MVAHIAQEPTGHNGGHDLGGHGEGVVEPRKLAHLAAFAHFHHHGQTVDVDGRPGKAHQQEQNVENRAETVDGNGQQIPAQEAAGEQQGTHADGLSPANFTGQRADGNIAEDGTAGGDGQARVGLAQAHAPDVFGVNGEPGGNAVIAYEPQADGNQQESQAPLHIGGQGFTGFGVLGKVVLWVLLFILLLPLHQHRLVDQEHDHCQGRGHDPGYNGEQGEEADVAVRLDPVQEGGHQQIANAADGTHQVDNGVGLGAQGLGGDVRHQCHGGAAVCTHGNEQQSQGADKQGQGAGLGGGVVAVSKQRQHQHQDDGGQSAKKDKGSAAAQGAFALVRESAEQGQQEQGQNIVRRHNGAGEGFVQMKGIGQNQWHQVVVHLPESADGEKGKSHQDCSLGVEFHKMSSRINGFFVPLL